MNVPFLGTIDTGSMKKGTASGTILQKWQELFHFSDIQGLSAKLPHTTTNMEI